MTSTQTTYRCAVIGNPVDHSRSPDIHRAFAESARIALVYDKIQATAETFPETVAQFFAQGGHGLNITLPFKTQAAELAEIKTPAVITSGTANTLWRDKNNRLHADNTDGAGLRADLRYHGLNPKNQRILIIGAGGAARGIFAPLIEAGAQVDIANRTLAHAEAVLKAHADIAPNSQALPLNAAVATAYDLIINATSAGLDGDNFPIPTGALASGKTACYDLVYGRETPFMQGAKTAGAAQVLDGTGMLIEQARLSFWRWFGRLPGRLDTLPEGFTP